jgi:CheY-like chemotaxis protein
LSCVSGRVLIVEDEILVALGYESIADELGLEVAGIAADSGGAMRLAQSADIALVDLNLRDGPTGIEIGRRLANDHKMGVIFVTANPAQLGPGVDGAVGVMTKPVADDSLRGALAYLAGRLDNNDSVPPPRGLRLFAAA